MRLLALAFAAAFFMVIPYAATAQSVDVAIAQADAGDLVAAGKAALQAKSYDQAIALFTKASISNDAAIRREGSELLGFAHERAGHLAHARAVYRTYLATWPDGAAAVRVRMRLSGVVAAMEDEAASAFAARKKQSLKADTATTVEGLVPSQARSGILPVQPETKSPDGWQWDRSGSVSTFYYRDDRFADFRMLRGTLGDHEVGVNDTVATGDFTLHGTEGGNDVTIRASGFDRTNLDNPGGENEFQVSTAYVDMRSRLSGLSLRAGRQSRYGGGVFGRFDGALVGLQVNEHVLLQAVVGSPIYYGNNSPFADGRVFYGASIDLATIDKMWAGTLYAIEQDIHSAVDRRAVGGELRFSAFDHLAAAGLDYDIFYNELNNAYVSDSWKLNQKLTLDASLDYRRVPFLLTSNALIGQSSTSLSDLIGLFGQSETQALAVDRTARSLSATIGLSYDLSEAWQIALDATIADYSGTPASGGVDAIPDPGIEYYLSAQLSGSGVFSDTDYVGLGLRFLDSSASQTWIADTSYRFAVNEKIRLMPRLRLAYRNSAASQPDELIVVPSLGLKYRFSDHWDFESELALRWEDTLGSGSDNADVIFNAGIRYSF